MLEFTTQASVLFHTYKLKLNLFHLKIWMKELFIPIYEQIK